MARIPVSPTRDQNLHIHQGSEWVDGTYHDGWHPVKRKHQGVTEEGRALHVQHTLQLREEGADRERAITAKYNATCDRCQKRILQDEPVWWHPKTKNVRHRGDGDCDGIVPPRSPKDETQPRAATKQDLAGFEEAIQAIASKFEEDKAELIARVEAAEQKATIARKASEAAQASIKAARRLEVVRPTASSIKVKKLKAQHAEFPKLLKLAAAGINVAMVGDAGSGKTFAPKVIADALGLDFYHIPLGPQTSKSDLLGYMNGAGKYVYSLLCRVYEHGGVGLLDEMDAANPATLTIINGMLEAMEAGFADKMRKRHPDCIFVAAMNTFGRGADMLFVGRTQLDAATLNRWYYLEWNTDWDLTRRLVKDDEWVNYVEKLYNSAAKQKVRVTIGMRTAIMGKKAMQAGDTREEAEHGIIWAPIKPDDKQKILAGAVRTYGSKKENEEEEEEDEGNEVPK